MPSKYTQLISRPWLVSGVTRGGDYVKFHARARIGRGHRKRILSCGGSYYRDDAAHYWAEGS